VQTTWDLSSSVQLHGRGSVYRPSIIIYVLILFEHESHVKNFVIADERDVLEAGCRPE
jgi:hypothetical protein